MSRPGDGTPEGEREGLDRNDSLNAPPEFQNNRSLWESIVVSRFGGATADERAQLQQSTYTGFVDRNVDPATRAAARDDALAGFSYFGVQFDWAQWRREMGY